MTKKFLTLITFSLIFCFTNAADFINNGIYYNIISCTEVEITGGKEEVYVGNVIIPEITEDQGVTYTVTAVGEYAFSGCFLMDTCILPNTIKVIKPWAFAKCGKMKSITLPNELTEIGEAGFVGCKALKSIDLPNKLEKIGKQAFAECGLKSLILPNSVIEIGQMAFNGCLDLSYFTAFAENPVFATPDGALYSKDCKTIIAFPNAKAKVYTILPTVKTIGEYSFAGCSNLTNIDLGDNVTTICSNAFESCENIESVTIGKALTKIDSKAFFANKSLKGFKVSNENTAFSQESGVLFSKDGTKLLKYPDAYCDEYFIKGNVTEIGEYAFAGNESLKGVGTGLNIKKIGISAFELCSNLSYISLPINNLESIGDMAFFGCINLVGISFPNSLKAIGNMAFKDCDKLQTIDINDNITFLGERCFGNCTNLTEIVLGKGLTDIGNYAFYGCSSLTNIVCNQPDPLPIPANVFEYVDKNKCHLTVMPESVAKYREAPVWCEFLNIHDAGIGNIDCNVSVKTEKDRIIVDGYEGVISIFNLSGKCLYIGHDNIIEVPASGVYIVKADKSYKVFL